MYRHDIVPVEMPLRHQSADWPTNQPTK